METTVTSIVCIALIVVGGMTMSQNFMSSVDSSAAGLEEMSALDQERAQTDIDTLSATAGGGRVEITVRNSGQTKLASFRNWDVIIEHSQGNNVYVKWLPYVTGTPANNQWTVKGIYVSAATQTPDVIEPGVLNPGEEMIIWAELNPGASPGSKGRAVISTPNGVSAYTMLNN